VATCLASAAARSAVHAAGRAPGRAVVNRLRGGAAEPSDTLLQATFACNALYSSTLADSAAEVALMRKSVASGEVVADLGTKADALFADAAEKFAAGTPAGEADVMALYKAKAEELRASLSTALEPVFVAQIALLKDGALSRVAGAPRQPCPFASGRPASPLFWRVLVLGRCAGELQAGRVERPGQRGRAELGHCRL